MNKPGIYIRNWLVLLWLALLWGLTVQGQTPKSKQPQTYLRLADEYWQYEQYAEAARYYLKVTELNPDHLYATYQLAECNRSLFRYVSAEAGYGKVYYADTKTYPKALFYYALMQKLNGKYAYAIQNFEKFLSEGNGAASQQWPDKSDWIARATIEKDGCHFALLREKFAQRDFGFALLENPASTPANDYSPVIFEDDTSLLITSGRMLDSGRVTDTRLGEGFSNFYLLQKKGDQWDNVQEHPLLKTVNTKWNEGSGCFNRDKTKFYYTNCSEPNASCKIYVTTLHDGKWSKPAKLNSNINVAAADARHPALSVSGDSLFFVSNRAGGFGKNDIWVSVKVPNSENWSPAINMGNKINTALNELSPFINTEEDKFIFASEGHLGLGGLDIFVINGRLGREFEVMNLGPPFNSNRDDCFFVMGSTKGYLASNRTEGPGNFDLYTFDNFSRNTVIAGINQQTQKQTPDFYYLQEFNLEYLSDADKLSLERVASRKEAGKVYRQEMPLTENDLDFYQRLSQEERDRLERLVAFNIERKGGEEIIREEDQAYYQELSLEEKARVHRFAAAYRKAMLNRQKLTLDEEDEFYYQKLNSEGKRTLDRVVASRFSELEENGDSSMFVAENRFYYEKLPAAIKLPIQRDSVSQLSMGADSLHEEPEQYNYVKLNAEAVDRLERSNTMYTATNKNTGEDAFGEDAAFSYNKLSAADKDRIDRMAAARKAARSAGIDEKFSDRDQFYYVNLASEERTQLDQLINYHLAQERSGLDLSMLDEEKYSYPKIPGTEKHQLENKALNRKGHILPVVDTYWDEEGRPSTTLAELNTFQMGAYNSFTVRGRLYNTATKQPAASLTIPLTNERGEVIKTTTTNPDGTFMYINLSLKDSYRVLLQTPSTKVTDPAHFYVEDLEIIAYNADAASLNFEPVFFGFNEHYLRMETKKTLNALIAYYKLHPDIQIELDAFTDNVGTDEYNILLSQRRGEAVQKYLEKYGVSPGMLVMNARGKRTAGTAAGKTNGRATDRRVELIIKGAAGAFEPTTNMYIISPQTNLKRIAEKFGMSLNELKRINNIVTDKVEPYRPLKVKRL